MWKLPLLISTNRSPSGGVAWPKATLRSLLSHPTGPAPQHNGFPTLAQCAGVICASADCYESVGGSCRRNGVGRSGGPSKDRSHVVAVVVLAGGFRLVAEGVLIDADVALVAEMSLDDVV